MLDAGRYRVRVGASVAGTFSLLVDAVSNFNDSKPTENDDQTDSDTANSDDEPADDQTFYTDDLYVDNSDSADSADSAPAADDSSEDWLDVSADPLDSSSNEDLWT